jgi:trigger factor
VKVTTERLPKSVIALDIELDRQQVDKGLDRAARKLSQQYSIPGFRPGKAPRFIVENYLGRARIMEEASDDLINKAFQDAIKQENISPVGRPNLENVEENPFRFRVTVPVEPIVELGDYRSYGLPYAPEPISEETIQKLLDAQREQHAVLREPEEPRPAQPGDMLTVTMSDDLDEDEDEDEIDEDELDEDLDAELDEAIALDAEENGEDDEDDEDEDDLDDDIELVDDDEDDFDDEDDEDDEGEPEEQQLALVEDRMRPEIYQALVGAQPGETRTVTVHYGEDEEDEDLRGRDVTYTIDVKNVQDRLLPEWDELPTLTNFEGDFEALRANARRRLEHASEERARQGLLDAFVERATSDAQIDIPDAMIDERAHELFHEQVAQFSRYGLTEEQYLSALGKSHDEAIGQFREAAEEDVRRSLILREFIRREGLDLQEQDIADERERFLQDYSQDQRETMRPLLESADMTRVLASAALDRKLRERLIAVATNGGPAAEAPAATPEPAASVPTDETGAPAPVDESGMSSGAGEGAVVVDGAGDADAESAPETVSAPEAPADAGAGGEADTVESPS